MKKKKLKFNKIYKLSKKNKLFAILILIIIIILIVLAVILGISLFREVKEKKVEFNFKTKYEAYNDKEDDFGRKYLEINIPSNNKIKEIDVNETLDIFSDKKDAVIYFGYASCTYCRSAAEILIETANETDLDKIYYLDTGNESENYDKLLELFVDEFKDDDEIYSPLVLFVSDGNIISYHKGTLFSQNDPFMKLDDSQREGLSEIYRSGINDVVKSIK